MQAIYHGIKTNQEDRRKIAALAAALKSAGVRVIADGPVLRIMDQKTGRIIASDTALSYMTS